MTHPTYATESTRPPLGITFLLLLVAHIAIKFWVGTFVLKLNVTGDENAYIDTAMALSNLLRDVSHLLPPDIDELRRNVVVNGWFMPGMGIILTPLYSLVPNAEITTVRIYLGCVSFLLWLWAIISVDRHLGRTYTYALMVFPSLVPLWIAFSFTAWGDLYAGLLLVVLFCHSFTAIRIIHGKHVFGVKNGVGLGALAVAALYLRSSVSPLLLLLIAFFMLAALISSRNGSLRAFRGIAAMIATIACLLMPWSMTASNALGARVVTTTTAPISMAVTFGDRQDICFGPCKSGNIWFSTVAYSKAVALDAGVSELMIQNEMSRNAMREVSHTEYLNDVFENFERYIFNPDSFAHLFANTDRADDRNPTDSSKLRESWLRGTTNIPYYSFIALWLASWFYVTRSTYENQIASILIKLFSIALVVQPFIHVSGGRYWPTFGPLFALSGGLLWSRCRERYLVDCGNVNRGNRPSTLLTILQWAFIISVVGLAATMAILDAQGSHS